jgi:hypothetical protein
MTATPLIDWYQTAGAGLTGLAIGLALALVVAVFWAVVRGAARVVGVFSAHRIHIRDTTLARLQAKATARAERKARYAKLREDEKESQRNWRALEQERQREKAARR